jgi:hypothetical protein
MAVLLERSESGEFQWYTARDDRAGESNPEQKTT